MKGFAELFAGRDDAWGTEDGGCLRTPYVNGVPNQNAVAGRWQGHLSGDEPIGVYPMRPYLAGERDDIWLWECKWGCVDLDVKREGKRRYDYETEEDAIAAAMDLREALRLLGLTGWIERTRSGGYHVWVFAEEWVSAATMRRALLVACQVANVPPTEVNPKSESFADPAQLGNYVRLPYPGALARGQFYAQQRRVMINADEYLTLPLFLDAASRSLGSTFRLEKAAALWQQPTRIVEFHIGELPEIGEALQQRCGALVWLKLTEGPLDDHIDRSNWLFSLARNCADDGLEPEEAFVIVQAADEAWTRKYVERRDGGVADIERTVERAYR